MFWVQLDQTNGSAAKSRERTGGSLTNLVFIDLRPNTCTNRVWVKRYFVELLISCRMVSRLNTFIEKLMSLSLFIVVLYSK